VDTGHLHFYSTSCTLPFVIWIFPEIGAGFFNPDLLGIHFEDSHITQFYPDISNQSVLRDSADKKI